MRKCLNVGWSIGNFCNAKCIHCYSWKGRQNNRSVLTQEEIDLIIEKLINYGVETVNFGGNEPIFTDGPDLSETKLPYILKRLSQANIRCGITTNGFSSNYLFENYRDVFELVNDWDFSLDSHCRLEHDNNRRCAGLFDLVIKSIKICKENKRPCSIVIAGMKSNLTKESINGFITLAEELDTELRINLLKPTQPEHFALMPSPEQAYETFDYLSEKMDFISLSEPVLATQMGVSLNGCPCGTNSFRIRAKVNNRVPVTPCVYLDLDGGDILTESIDDIVNSGVFTNFINRNIKLPRKCIEAKCNVVNQCRGGCSARTLLVTNNTDEVDPYCAFIAKAGIGINATPNFVNKNENSQVRVHENYLCTWIGKPKCR